MLGSLVGLLVLALGAVYLLGDAKLNKKYAVPVESITIPANAQAIQRGEHLAGQVYFDAPGLLTIPSPNLTNEEDTAALLAYLKQLPPVDNELPERSFEPIAKVMTGVGAMPPMPVDLVDHAAPYGSVGTGLTPDYGSVLAATCKECHGEKLNGTPFGPPGQEVMSPNLTPGGELAAWTESDFTRTMRTGVTPTGRRLNEEMPWKYYGKMTDDELKAIWLFLRSQPSLKTGE